MWLSEGSGAGDLQPVLTVTPREIDLGSLGPGEEGRSLFYLNNVGSGKLDWSMEGPSGWTKMDAGVLSGAVSESPEPVKIHLVFLNEKDPEKMSNATVILTLEGGGQKAAFRRVMPVGAMREQMRITSLGGIRTIFVNARLSVRSSASLLSVEPLRLDFGTVRPGEQITRRVLIKNRGKETLKWKATPAGKRKLPATEAVPRGRYVTFLNTAGAGTGSYSVAGPLRDHLELSGIWGEEGGYPATQLGEQGALRYRFTGTGAALHIQKTPEGDPLMIYLDDQLITLVDGYSERRESLEIVIAEELAEGPHLLAVVSDGGRVIIEGVRVLGRPIMKGPPGWINVFPDSGTTTRETDYVNIVINTPKIATGLFGEMIFFTSNGGDAAVEVFVEAGAETQTRVLDVYRYVSGSDYLYTANPQAEASRLQVQGYRSLGIAFRLFPPGTPGTTEFFRWFNPVKGDHFYSSDPSGGGKALAGYLLEGSIGNIATFRLAGTRELYRWYHPANGRHFYTTDQGGEGFAKKGYRFDGIAGFVR
ncbi:MAG: hypothetical protein FJ122_04565 [Deltaproteobacteria bacterium]|nr:hypothetical protein [Deltaproteobacteria bacterium]